jgi:hypothetical protein
MGKTADKPWWNDYHGKAAEVALARAFNVEPSWKQEPDGGYDVRLTSRVTADSKFNWHPAGIYGCWLYLPWMREESKATILVLATVYKEPTDRSYLLRGWIPRSDFIAIRDKCPFDPRAKGVHESYLSSMNSLVLYLQGKRNGNSR